MTDCGDATWDNATWDNATLDGHYFVPCLGHKQTDHRDATWDKATLTGHLSRV